MLKLPTIRAVAAALILMSAADASAQTTFIRFGKLWDGEKLAGPVVVQVESDRIVRVTPGHGRPGGCARDRSVALHRTSRLASTCTRTSPTSGTARRARGRAASAGCPAVTVFLAQENARRTLETGVTTVRDLDAGNDMDFAMRDLIAVRRDDRSAHVRVGTGPVGAAGRRPRSRCHAEAGRGAHRGRRRLDQGLRLARQVRERGRDADGHLRRDEGDRRRRARARQARGHSLVRRRRASATPSAPAPTPWSTAPIWTTRRIAEMAKRGTVWVPTIDHNRYYVDAKDEYGFAPGSTPRCRTTSSTTSSRRGAR